MGKRLCMLISLVLTMVVTSGCWNSREAEDLEYVLGAGIDYNNKGQVVLTVLSPVLEAIKPHGAVASEQKKTLSVTGSNTFEAASNYFRLTGRKLFWSDLQVLLIGEEAAKRGVDRFLDFFAADPELRDTSYLAVVKGRALDMLEASPDISENSASYLKSLLSNSNYGGKNSVVIFNEFARMQASPTGKQPYAPMVRLYTQDQYMAELGIKPYPGKESKQSVLYQAEGTAIFHNHRMVGYLNEDETRGLLWIKGTLKSTVLVVPCREEDCQISLRLTSTKTKPMNIRYENNQLIIGIHIVAEFNIGEKGSQAGPTDDAYIRYLEEKFGAEVKKEIADAFHTAVIENNSDVFAFGNHLEDRKPTLWAQLKGRWEEEILPRAKLDVQVKATMRRASRNLYTPWINEGRED